MPHAAVLTDRIAIGAAIVLTAILFTAQAADPVNIIKMTALVLCALTLLASAAVVVLRTRLLHLPWGVPVLAAIGLLAAFVVVAAGTPVLTTAVLGTYGRNSGLLVYASAIVLFLAGVRVFQDNGGRAALYALLLAGTFTAGYGLLQYVGVDSVSWNNPFNPIIAALGNPNFAAAYLAICTPAAVWGALRNGWVTPGFRVLSGLLAAACLLAALLSNAAQGPLAAAPGLAVLAAAWLLDQQDRLRRTGLAALGAVTTIGLAVLGAGIAGVGPAAGVFGDIGSRARGYYWEGAFQMWQREPLLGVGLDTYGAFWRLDRPDSAVVELGGDNFADAAHSVPLHLLATGGAVLGVAYLVFTASVAVALVLGLRRLRGQERLLLGGVGGCWAAYQVQSLVSIDQVPLIVTHFVLAAAVVATARTARLRELRLPGAAPLPPVNPVRRTSKVPVSAPRPRSVSAPDRAGMALVVAVALGLAWLSLLPLRANIAVLNGDGSVTADDRAAALQSFSRATSLVPGEARYWARKGDVYRQLEKPGRALEAYERAVQADPLDIDFLRQAAQAAEDAGDLQRAGELYDQALQIDPAGPKTVLAAAAYGTRHDQAPQAAELLERTLEVLPGQAGLWAVLGDARRALDDRAGAEAAYSRALELDPAEATAAAGLAALDG